MIILEGILNMKSFFFFDSMLTPKLITVFYWLTLFVVVFTGIMGMNSGYQGITTTGVFLGIGSILVGVLVARIWFELMIVLFKINDNLQALRDNKE
ncbi:DUF4282 domain-containing protein [Vibrio vulnificus]|uniref:DUF4282 domain-containing protein n=1 Tax=Vibrio vulnificus TaxID=672 RepID=UPI001EEB8F31|nr:DUF4282 domain-containing protein [Vibrio vulnificus]MCG6270640.1 DUF4282 domain-containing protein [Vibrio vulnificus]